MRTLLVLWSELIFVWAPAKRLQMMTCSDRYALTIVSLALALVLANFWDSVRLFKTLLHCQVWGIAGTSRSSLHGNLKAATPVWRGIESNLSVERKMIYKGQWVSKSLRSVACWPLRNVTQKSEGRVGPNLLLWVGRKSEAGSKLQSLLHCCANLCCKNSKILNPPSFFIL
jgi:hypothetical protein